MDVWSSSRRCDGLGARHVVSRARFNANLVVHGFPKSLSTTEVPLRRLHRDVPQEKLNLLKLTAGHMTEAGATAAKIMRCDPGYSEYSRVLFDNMPGDLLGDVSPHARTARHMQRNSLPLVTPAPAAHSSIVCFTQPGTGTVRMWSPFPTRSTIAQWSSRR